MGVSSLFVNFVLFVAKLFLSRHNGTKTLKKNNKIKFFLPWLQIFLGSGPSALLRLAGGRACPGWGLAINNRRGE